MQHEDQAGEAYLATTTIPFHKICRLLKRDEEQSLLNRLASIEKDARFVSAVKRKLPSYPLVANLRCGLWYFPSFEDTCYFKSTDGHTGYWQFSLKRLNLNVALLAAKNHGCIIVDSTRKGKLFPDSFSRTVPIWACVINRSLEQYRREHAVVDENPKGSSSWDTTLHVPHWVSSREKEQIEQHIDGFVQSLLAQGSASLELLAKKLVYPLRPYWIFNPGNHILEAEGLNGAEQDEISVFHARAIEHQLKGLEENTIPIICVSASWAPKGDMTGYIQGAGDDEESWSQGLTPSLFWRNRSYILNYHHFFSQDEDQDQDLIFDKGQQMDESTIMNRINFVVKKTSEEKELLSSDTMHAWYYRIATTGFIVGYQAQGQLHQGAWPLPRKMAVLDCSISVESTLKQQSSTYLHFPILEGKRHKGSLLKALPKAMLFVKENLYQQNQVFFYSSENLSVPICLCIAALALYFDNTSSEPIFTKQSSKKVNKSLLQKLLMFVNIYCYKVMFSIYVYFI
ncbi:tRNA A64-2'-O-ribosylphosphate transferase, variant 3 [Balamuthia mandrillaris]